MMRLNSHVGHVRTKTDHTQKTFNSDMSTQKTPNSYVYSTDESESKMVKADESKSNICYTEKANKQGLLSIRSLWMTANQKV